jgi:hypothetical protein
MNRLHILHQLILADFRERTRRYSFLLTLLGALFFGYLVITGKYTIQFSEYRSIYNSDWIGTLMAVTCAIMFTVVGFYLVKNSITRDRRTEVGQIIAATPISRIEYILAKFISNVSVLWVMVAVLAAVALVWLLFRGETGSVDLWAFATPFLLIPVPAMVLVAAAAVLFDTARWLRGSLGNIIYLFMAEVFLVLGMFKVRLLDLGGANLFVSSVSAAAEQAYPGVKIAMQAGFIGIFEDLRVEGSKTFSWDGIDWTVGAILLRSVWIVAAVFIVALAVPLFDRFDPARGKRRAIRKKAIHLLSAFVPNGRRDLPAPNYSRIAVPQPDFSFVGMLIAELRLMLKGYHWLWYLVAVGLLLAQLAAPFEIARMYITPVSMIWPLVIWSSMGTRESRYNTAQLLFSSPRPVSRQFPAMWIGGLLIALAAMSCMLVRVIFTGNWSYLVALLVGVLFAPSLALALGTLSGSKKLFEVTYLMIWYVGSIDHVEALDLLGTTDGAVYGEKLAVYFLLSVVMWGIAALARRRQVLA